MMRTLTRTCANSRTHTHTHTHLHTHPHTQHAGECKVVGWEKNIKGKMGPRMINLGSSMNPEKYESLPPHTATVCLDDDGVCVLCVCVCVRV